MPENVEYQCEVFYKDKKIATTEYCELSMLSESGGQQLVLLKLLKFNGLEQQAVLEDAAFGDIVFSVDGIAIISEPVQFVGQTILPAFKDELSLFIKMHLDNPAEFFISRQLLRGWIKGIDSMHWQDYPFADFTNAWLVACLIWQDLQKKKGALPLLPRELSVHIDCHCFQDINGFLCHLGELIFGAKGYVGRSIYSLDTECMSDIVERGVRKINFVIQDEALFQKKLIDYSTEEQNYLLDWNHFVEAWKPYVSVNQEL